MFFGEHNNNSSSSSNIARETQTQTEISEHKADDSEWVPHNK